MTEREMLKFAKEQLEVFSETSEMGKFLLSVIDYIENEPKFVFNAAGNNNTFVENVGTMTMNFK